MATDNIDRTDLNLTSPEGINRRAFAGNNMQMADEIVNLRDSLPAARFDGEQDFKIEAENSIRGWNKKLEQQVTKYFFVSSRYPSIQSKI